MVENTRGFLPYWVWVFVAVFLSTLLEPIAFATTGPIADSGLEFVAMTKAPFARVKRGGMIALQALVRNSSSAPAVGQLVGRLAGQSGEEDRRQIELAAGEEKNFDLHLRVSTKATASPISIIVTLNAMENGREVVLQKKDEPVSKTLSLDFDNDGVSTAAVLPSEPFDGVYWRWPRAEPYGSYELALGSRIDLGLSRRCILLDNQPMPLSTVDWKGIDTLIIGKSETLESIAVLTAIQHFLQRGGRVLVLLDEVDTELVRPLLVHDQQCETIDTVELNRIVMEVKSPTPISLEERTINRDKPMRMKRVLQHGGQVTHSVDGWPAVISMNIGSGELFLSTLECNAWLKTRISKSADEMWNSNFSVPLWGGTISNALNSPRLQDQIEAMEPSYPIEMIGSPVVSRQLVGIVLIGFCVLLVGAGIVAVLGGDLRRIGILAPALAVLSAIPIVVAAMWSKNDIPPMVSELQFVQFWPNGGGLFRSKAAVYLELSQSMDLVAESDGFAVPSGNIESGIRKLTTQDFESWKLSNTDWPPGTWRYKTEMGLSRESFSAKSKLTASGLTLEIPQGLPSIPEDVVVCFTPGSLSLVKSTDQNQTLLVDGELPAEGDRWTSASIVSDEQGRRAAVYKSLFVPFENRGSPAPRTLYFWTTPWQIAPQWSSSLERRGSALVSVPIELDVPEVGAKVLIPYSMIKIEPQDISLGVSTIFNYRTGRWADESSLETVADLSFVIPPEAVPLEAIYIDIDWDIEAPKRNVKLIWSAQSAPVEIVELNSPSIPWRGRIEDPRVMQDLRDGRLDLRIAVTNGDSDSAKSQNSVINWQIKHLRLSIFGQTLPRSNLVKTAAK